ncbi:MAG: cyclase family protein [Chloroflexota bacterium]|nr:cyclase family protein [Chloroflexota bacterium]
MKFEVAKSPWGAQDEIGALNLITSESRSKIMAQADASRVFDLSVEYFVGMPTWSSLGDPVFQIWMTHNPRGDVVSNPLGLSDEANRYTSYSGDAMSLYTHCGTHIDALNHFGCYGKIWNQFEADQHLGNQTWKVCGVDKMPPIISRGVLLDVAGLHGVDMLAPSYGIGRQDLEDAANRQGVSLEKGDTVLIRTGRMRAWPDAGAYLTDEPGLNLEGARWLAEDKEVMLIGGDNVAVEQLPAEDPDTWLPVHMYLFNAVGRTLLEVVNMEELAAERVYEFAFIALPLKLRGASASPIRVIAMPLKH